ncbi:hypothetical protein [Pseudomonas sp. Irchel s3h9]|uniref:hypothetical protein n=1 Tax=Pseudomonas sp. Irchel s3h9 TaxID=2009192 RepID=UPI000BA2C520|nr:hypothetical protein [Pseudomonas sp. Irchel s3h9]
MNKLVCGWGINDADYEIQVNKPHFANGVKKYVTEFDCPYYRRWSHMLMRCHSGKFRSRNPTYANTTVCDEWKSFSKFRAWMESMPWQGNELDKDILGDGTYYSPQTCCFVPKSVNVFWTKCGDKNSGLVGVSFHKASGKYRAQCNVGNHRKALGYFSSELEAHAAWVNAKAESLAILLASVELEERIVQGMHRKLRVFEERLSAQVAYL